MGQQEIDRITAAEKDALRQCEEARQAAEAEKAAAEKAGAAAFEKAVSNAESERARLMEEADRRAEAFKIENDKKTDEECKSLRSGAEAKLCDVAAMIVERIRNG